MVVLAIVINKFRVASNRLITRAAAFTKIPQVALLTIWILILPVKLGAYNKGRNLQHTAQQNKGIKTCPNKCTAAGKKSSLNGVFPVQEITFCSSRTVVLNHFGATALFRIFMSINLPHLQLNQFLEYKKFFIHGINSPVKVKLKREFSIVKLNVMPELGAPQPIIRSGALYQSLRVLYCLSWLCPNDFVFSSGAVAQL